MASSANSGRAALKFTSATSRPNGRTSRRSNAGPLPPQAAASCRSSPHFRQSLTCRPRRCYVAGHAEDRPPGCVYRHQGRGRAAALRSGAAGGLSGEGSAGFRRAARGAPVQGRPVQPDLSPGNAVAEIRAAAKAAGQALAVGACGRPRIPCHRGARRQALSGRRAGALLRRRERRRHAVLCDGLCRRPGVLESRDAGIESA